MHLLQLLNVACFLLLKCKYSNKILALVRSCIYYINKENFLLAFKATFIKVFTLENVCAGFRGAGLVLHNLEAVLLKLDVRLCTPTPPQPDNVAWEARTLRNAREVEEQLTLIWNRIQFYQGSSASLLDEQVRQLTKGAQQIAYNIVLVQEEISRL